MRIKRAMWLVAVLGVAAPAIAAPTEMIRAPAGWHRDAEQASALARQLDDVKYAGFSGTAATEAYVAAQPGVALFARRVRVPDKQGTATGAIARAMLDDLRASAQRAGVTVEPTWAEQLDAASQQAAGELRWSDAASHTHQAARIIITKDSDDVVAVTGECVLRDDAEVGARDACLHALTTLDADVPRARRAAISLPAAGTAREATAPPASSAAMTELPGAHGLDDGNVRLPPQHIALDPPAADHQQTLVLGGGLIVLAAAFLWNRKRREQIARDDARRERGDRQRRPRRSRDADADDLHAAARGEDREDHHEPDEPTPP